MFGYELNAPLPQAPSRGRRAVNRGGSHPCVSGCGRLVSNNKLACLDCITRSATAELAARGIPTDESEVAREMRKAIYG